MSDKYNLSIAIPAFGYPKALQRNLENLLSIERNDVEIVIVDNDPSGEQIGEFVNSIRDSRFRYYRNSENIGRSANIVKAVEMSTSSHVLLVSCDDTVCTGVVDRLIEMVKQHPKCGVIMGRIRTDTGNVMGYLGSEGFFKKGYDALNNIPSMGTLFPFVINRDYLNFEQLYLKEETYMQNRLLIIGAGRGGFVGMSETIAEVVDQESYREEGRFEAYEVCDWKEIMKSWSLVDGCYYSPKARALQLKRDIETIEELPLRLSHMVRIVDLFVKRTIPLIDMYVVSCHDPHVVKNGGTVGFLDLDECLDIFYKEMVGFFEIREEKGLYCYTGQLKDRIKNERIVFSRMTSYMHQILNEKKVSLFGSAENKRKLSRILKYMGVSVSDDSRGMLTLVSENYEEERESEIMKLGSKGVIFFDWMPTYLITSWMNEHYNENIFGEFSSCFWYSISDDNKA